MKSSLRRQRVALEGLILFTVTIGMILASSTTRANSATDQVTWTVQPSCTMSSSTPSGGEHSASMMSGEYKADIGATTATVICNDSEGLDIYAVGNSGDELGNTDLISNVGSNYNIPTGVYSSGDANSSWSMKLTNMNDGLTSVSGKFGNYISVPNTWDKVAYRDSSTGVTAGSSFQATYSVYASGSQPAGSYNGQVKYIVVHPYNTTPPSMPKTISDLEYMQDFATLSSEDKTSVLSSMPTGTQYQLKDSRDQKNYYISKLADGNIWMTQNLDFDIVDGGVDIDYTNTDVPEDWEDAGDLADTYTTDDTTWDWYADTPESYDPGDLCWNGTPGSDATQNCNQNGNHYHLGNYYNWTVAVAMSDSSSYASNNTDANQSICPAGWMLPKSGDQTGTGSFSYLVNQASLTAGASGNIHTTPNWFVYGGEWTGLDINAGWSGYYWSSVVFRSAGSYALYFYYDGNLAPQYNPSRSMGYSVRCVAR